MDVERVVQAGRCRFCIGDEPAEGRVIEGHGTADGGLRRCDPELPT